MRHHEVNKPKKSISVNCHPCYDSTLTHPIKTIFSRSIKKIRSFGIFRSKMILDLFYKCQFVSLLMKFRNHKYLLDSKFTKDHPSCNLLNFLLGRIVNDKRFHTKCVYDGLTGSHIITVGLVKAAQTISSGERPTFQNFGLEFFFGKIITSVNW